MKLITIIAIVGTVLCSKSKEPLAGVKVTGNNQVVYTDFDGKFKIDSDTFKLEYISYKDTLVVNDSIIHLKFIIP